MDVALISTTEDLLKTIYTAARTCYSEETPIDIFSDNFGKEEYDKALKLISACIKSGHHSVLEHSYFVFAIDGISRACSHQLVRHRLCSFSQQSQRYVKLNIDNDVACRAAKHGNLNTYLKQYFTDVTEENSDMLITVLHEYNSLIEKGVKAEDARAILPNCTKTNIVLSCNLRELMHLAEERLCTRAQTEIRMLVSKMVRQVIAKEPWLSMYLVPKCERLGYCPEHNGCGRKEKKPNE